MSEERWREEVGHELSRVPAPPLPFVCTFYTYSTHLSMPRLQPTLSNFASPWNSPSPSAYGSLCRARMILTLR